MIGNTNEGSKSPPRLRIDINDNNIFGLPEFSSVPRGSEAAVFAAVRSAGFEGVQTETRFAAVKKAGLRLTSSARIDEPADAKSRATEAKDRGADCLTVHVGRGHEDDDQVDRLVHAMIEASVKHAIPIYLETHRATITQDTWRTVQLCKRIPEVRFNGDFSHYYTGLELPYGDLEDKYRFMQPIFDRVRFIHGRIGNSGCIQVDIADRRDKPNVESFRQMWQRSFAGFLKSAGPGDLICFTPELLGPDFNYARVFPDPAGQWIEESDRWQQAQLLVKIAKECFALATTETAKVS